ncbi:MAG: hypothetical protein H6976_08465 [Gammaproteobacteria bacterium]|nr:hypothetical protein [Gammaproteobacteria bacterium]
MPESSIAVDQPITCLSSGREIGGDQGDGAAIQINLDSSIGGDRRHARRIAQYGQRLRGKRF